MTEEEIQRVRQHPFLRTSEALRRLLDEAVDPASKGSALELDGRRLQQARERSARSRSRWQTRAPDHLGEAHDLMYMADGDTNGLFSFLGTEMGRKGFVNPVVERRLSITCSGPLGKHCDPKLLASRKFVNTSYAGPCYENGAWSTWWRFDLAEGLRLAVNYYTIRHDGSDNFPRNWALQGSADGAEWATLREHAGDESIRRRGQFCSWPVAQARQRPVRALRLVLTGPNASANPAEGRRFCLAGAEFYGQLYIDAPRREEGASP
mmetsp:Transcript_36759/g.87332  ORF Transcript_36759/g.87332 Transcript_36759/m.87332 type:complete len:265 (+) Transcript_36759:322-1116(+)